MDFTVEPQAVRQLARGFQAAADGAGHSEAGLAGSVRLPASAFGRLGQARAAAGEYDRKLADAGAGLRALQAALRQIAVSLGVVTANYEAADQASSAA